MTEYEIDGVLKDGPIICAPSLEVANIQAKELKLTIVSEMFPSQVTEDEEIKYLH